MAVRRGLASGPQGAIAHSPALRCGQRSKAAPGRGRDVQRPGSAEVASPAEASAACPCRARPRASANAEAQKMIGIAVLQSKIAGLLQRVPSASPA
jgi:hypothetical protein